MTAKIRREILEHPEKFDASDVPPPRKKIPKQEAAYDKLRPQWAKDLADSNKRG